MALIDCPKCNSEDITGTPQADSRLLITCANCGHQWVRGEARRDPSRPAVQTIDSLHAAFPTAADVRPDVRERLELLTSEFLLDRPETDPGIAAFRERYQELFSRDGLSTAPPEELLHFATSDTLASAGNMSGLNRAWKTQGPDTAAHKIRESIEHLLYGPESLRLEDRLTQLLDGKKIGFPSFNKEPLLTKVLCVVEPDRFLPVLKYSAPTDGKKEIAKLVFDLDLPAAEKTANTIGRLAIWSNDLLRSLVGNTIPDLHQATKFLAWAKTRPALSRT
jgi:Zn ribbon nucleic-acid-binding protein